MTVGPRDRDAAGRPRNARARDSLGRPLPRGAAGGPPPDEAARPPLEALRLGQQLLDGGHPFTAHEVFEAVWKAAPDEQRALWRGLAQICVAVTHHARGNSVGAARLRQRAAVTLAAYAGQPLYGVDVTGLLAWCAQEEATVPRLTFQAARERR